MLELYTHLVRERHSAWLRRQAGETGPWSDDPIIATTKFTNVFRVIDHGSQYLLTEMLQEPGLAWEDVAFRAWAYRFTNRPEPWDTYRQLVGSMPTLEQVREGVFEDALRMVDRAGVPLYSNAYMIHLGTENAGMSKLDFIVRTANREWQDDAWLSLLEASRGDDRLQHRVLCQLPRVANFMALQILTDIGYVDPEHDEDAFVVEGPGSLKGARLLDPILHYSKVFEIAQLHLELAAPEVYLELPDGRKHYPSLMDVQNTFCEFDKYVRRRARERNSRFTPRHDPLPPVLPAHW